MKEISCIRDIQDRILAIGKEFHRIMVAHGIPYYMLGGTQLGAVRHHGFIPWDDDMDFGITRPFYQKAIDVLREDVKSPYRLLTVDDKVMASEYFKIEDTSTIIREVGRNEESSPIGLFIDVFPIDVCNDKWGRLSRNSLIRQFMWYNSFQYNTPSKFYHRCVAFFSRILPNNFFLTAAHKMLIENGDYLVNYAGMYGKKEMLKKEVYGNPVLYQFEDTVFFGVEDFDPFLKSLYGDYMQFPPEDQRHTHLLGCYLKEK